MRAFLAISLLVSCGGSSAEKPPAEEPALHHWEPPPRKSKPPSLYGDFFRGGNKQPPVVRDEPTRTLPDAVEAGPAVYKVMLENDEVRVLVADYRAGTRVPMHRHPDRVDFIDGSARFEKAGNHIVDGALVGRAVVVELGAKPGSARPDGDDPVAKLPRIYKVLLDEARVRVLDVTFGKGRSKPVALGDHVLLARDRGTLVVTPRGASEERLELEPGKLLFVPAGVYTATNPEKESFEVILFELKP